MNTFDRISVAQAEALLSARDSVMLLDMRDARAYCQGHDPRAVHLSQLNLRKLLRNTPKQVHLIFCCAHGEASQDMARLFGDFGFLHCYSLDGGYAAWQARPQQQIRTPSARQRKALAHG